MGFFVYFSVPLLCTVLFRQFLRQPAGSLFLEGLQAYMPRTAAIPTPPPGAKTSKRDKKLLQRRQLQLKEAQSYLVVQQLSPSALHHLSTEPSTFGANFETLGVLLLVLLIGVLVHFTLGPLLGLWQEVLLYTLGPLIILWAASQLLLLEAGGAVRRLLTGDRIHVAALAAAAAVGCYGLLVAAPAGWLRWGDVRAAAPEFDKLFNGGLARLLASRLRHHSPPPQLSAPLESDPHTIAAVMAVVAGLLAAALLSPSARIAKLYSYISPVPQWAEKYITPHPAAGVVVRLALTLPLVVVLYGIKPMSDFWGLPPAVLTAIGPALVAATAVVQLLAVRPLAGAHLGGGLLEWHLLRHEAAGGGGSGTATAVAAGGGSTAGAGGAREVVLRKRLTLVYATVCQVALQLLAPAAILLCLGLLYGSASGALEAFRPPAPLLFNLNRSPNGTNHLAALSAIANHSFPSAQTMNGTVPGLVNSASSAVSTTPPVHPSLQAQEPHMPKSQAPASAAAATAATGANSPETVLLEGLDLDEAVPAASASTAAPAATAAASDPVEAEAATGESRAATSGFMPPMPPLDFVRYASGFLAWWCCAVMCLFTYPMLFVYRAGLHVG